MEWKRNALMVLLILLGKSESWAASVRSDDSTTINESHQEDDPPIINENPVIAEEIQVIVQELKERNRQLENENAVLRKCVIDLSAENEGLHNDTAALKKDLSALHEDNDKLQLKNKRLSEHNREAILETEEANRELADIQQHYAQVKAERDSLSGALKDSGDALRDVEANFTKTQAALKQLQIDMENRLKEKDEEIENIRKNNTRTIEELQRTLIEAKAEISRLKKEHETKKSLPEEGLDVAHRAKAECTELTWSLQLRVKDLEAELKDKLRINDNLSYKLSKSERTRDNLLEELEDARSMLATAQKKSNILELELEDTRMSLEKASLKVTSLTNDKLRLERDMATLQNILGDHLALAHKAQKEAQRLAVENERLADELQQKNENSK